MFAINTPYVRILSYNLIQRFSNCGQCIFATLDCFLTYIFVVYMTRLYVYELKSVKRSLIDGQWMTSTEKRTKKSEKDFHDILYNHCSWINNS